VEVGNLYLVEAVTTVSQDKVSAVLHIDFGRGSVHLRLKEASEEDRLILKI